MCCKQIPKVSFKANDPQASLPTYESIGAACADVRSIETKDVPPGCSVIFRTGLCPNVPVGYVIRAYSRSGHGFKFKVRLANCVGIIDSDYTGEIMVALFNDGDTAFRVEAGDRIAQLEIAKSIQADFDWTDVLKETERGAKGFGSTGGGVERQIGTHTHAFAAPYGMNAFKP